MTKSLLLGTSILAAATLAGTAFAQDDEIIVTATKREQTLQEVPVAVSVVDKDVLEKAQINDLYDMQSVVPSLRISTLERAGNTTFIIRGFGNGGNNIGVEPSVAVFVDGVFRSRAPASLGDLPALERVEVLRGPQNTLFGKGASAGVISIVTQKPQFEWQGSVEATAGNYSLGRLAGYVTGPIGENTAFSLAGNMTKRDGYADELISGETINDKDRWGIRAQLLHEASDNVSIRFIADMDQADEICCYVPYYAAGPSAAAINALGGNVVAGPYAYQTTLNRLPENEIENWGVSQHVDIAFDWADFKSITSYRESYNMSNGDVDFGSAPLIFSNLNDVNIDTFTQEFRLNGDAVDGRLNWLAGVFYLNESIGNQSNVIYDHGFDDYASLLTGGLTVGLEQALGLGEFFEANTGTQETFLQTNQNYSLFAQGDFEITDRLTATVGVGYVDDHKEVTASAINNDLFSSIDFASALNNPALLRALPLDQIPSIGATFDNIVLAQAFEAVTGNPFDIASYGAILQGAAMGDPTSQAILAGITTATPLVEVGVAQSVSGGLAASLAPLQFLPGFIPLGPENPVENQDTDDTKTTYTLRLAYDWTDRVNVYGSYATGYKPSSWNLTRDSSPVAADFAQLQQHAIDNPAQFGFLAPANRGPGTRNAGPEDVTVWELGMKARFDRGTLNVAIFDQEIKGFQSVIFQGTGFVLANAGKQSATGLEFDGTFDVTDSFTVGASGTFLDPKYDSFTGAPVVTGSAIDLADGVADGSGDLSGATPAGIHKTSLAFNATYEADLGDGRIAFIRGDYQYEDKIAVVDNLPESIFTREVNLVNASAGINWENGLEAMVWGRNIFGDEYPQSGFPTTAQAGSFSGYPNQPSTYGVTVRKRF